MGAVLFETQLPSGALFPLFWEGFRFLYAQKTKTGCPFFPMATGRLRRETPKNGRARPCRQPKPRWLLPCARLRPLAQCFLVRFFGSGFIHPPPHLQYIAPWMPLNLNGARGEKCDLKLCPVTAQMLFEPERRFCPYTPILRLAGVSAQTLLEVREQIFWLPLGGLWLFLRLVQLAPQ